MAELYDQKPRWVVEATDNAIFGEALALGIDKVLLENKNSTVQYIEMRKWMIRSGASKTADEWIQKLNLACHVEGGAFVEVYRSALTLPHELLAAQGHAGNRAVSTSIYFLLKFGEFSAFHRIASDEMWHFYDGFTLSIFEIKSNGELIHHRLGKNIDAGERLQVVISAHSWFASRVESSSWADVDKETLFCLCGCTVAPGFDFMDFELADRLTLTSSYPQHAELIQELTR